MWLNIHFNLFRKIDPISKDIEPFLLPQELLETASIDDLKLLFSEAKDRVKATTEVSDLLSQRSVFIFSVGITGLSTIIGYIGGHLYINPSAGWDLKIIMLITIGIILWIVCSMLKANITPLNYFGLGTPPEDIATIGMFTNLQGKTPEWLLTAHLIQKYNDRSKVNAQTNKTKADTIDSTMNLLYSIPLIVGVISLLFGLFFNFKF